MQTLAADKIMMQGELNLFKQLVTRGIGNEKDALANAIQDVVTGDENAVHNTGGEEDS